MQFAPGHTAARSLIHGHVDGTVSRDPVYPVVGADFEKYVEEAGNEEALRMVLDGVFAGGGPGWALAQKKGSERALP